MVLSNKVVMTFGIKVTSNLFEVAVKNTETNKICVYRIGGVDKCNDYKKILYVFNSTDSHRKVMFVGYGNHKFDSKVINYILKFGFSELCAYDIYSFSKTIDDALYDHNSIFYSIDLQKMLFKEKERCDLRKIAFSLNLETNPDKEAYSINSYEEQEEVSKELTRNVETISKILDLSKDKIELRMYIFNKLKIDTLSSDDSSLGFRVITKKYMSSSNKTYEEIKSMKGSARSFMLKDFLKIEYKPKNRTIRQVFQEFEELCLNVDTKLNKTIFVSNLPINISMGGIHTINKPSSFVCENDDEVIVDFDFVSMYPTAMINFDLFPRQMDQSFKDLYREVYLDRLSAKMAENKKKDAILKLLINSVIGMMQSDWCYLYDPVMAISIRMNCQLIILEVLDMLLPIAEQVIQINTDGIFFKINRKNLVIIEKIRSKLSKLKFSSSYKYYTKMYQLNVNDYFAVAYDGEIVKKGFFAEQKLGKNLYPQIVVKSIIDNLLYNIDVKHTINNNNNIKNFLISAKNNIGILKVSDKIINNEVRYYYSSGKNSYYLTKNTEKYSKKFDSNSGVTIVNENLSISDRINYFPYYKMANEILSEFKQLKIFDIFV